MRFHYDEIVPLLVAAGAKEPEPGFRVWDLEALGLIRLPSAAEGTGLSPAARKAVLSLLLRGPLPVFLCPDEEPEADQAEEWVQVAEGVWRLPADTEPDTLLASPSIEYGNWRIVVAEKPPPMPLPDLIRSTAPDVTAFLQRHEVAVLVDSFHDDVMWRVALAEEASE